MGTIRSSTGKKDASEQSHCIDAHCSKSAAYVLPPESATFPWVIRGAVLCATSVSESKQKTLALLLFAKIKV